MFGQFKKRKLSQQPQNYNFALKIATQKVDTYLPYGLRKTSLNLNTNSPRSLAK